MQALNGLSARLESAPLSVQVRGQPFELDPARIGYHVDVGQSAGRAIKVGSSGGLFRQLSAWLRTVFQTGAVWPRVEPSIATKLEPILVEWEMRAFNDRPFDGGLAVRGDRWCRFNPVEGLPSTAPLPNACSCTRSGRERKDAVSLPLERSKRVFRAQRSRPWSSARRRSSKDRSSWFTPSRGTLWRFETSELLAALRTQAAPDRPGELDAGSRSARARGAIFRAAPAPADRAAERAFLDRRQGSGSDRAGSRRGDRGYTS